MAKVEDLALSGESLNRINSRVGLAAGGRREGHGLRIGLVASRFNGEITARLIDGAIAGCEECGVSRRDLRLAWVPGAMEIPVVAKAMLRASDPPDAVIALGAVIRGATGHYEVVAHECARGLQSVQLELGRPVVFGVLTVNNVEQALERSLADDTNKGREAAMTAVEMVNLLRTTPFD